MTEKTRELRKTLAEELLRRAAAAWEWHQKIRRERGDISEMRDAYDAFVRLLRPVYKHGFKKEVEDFLKKTDGTPVRAVLKRLAS